MFRVGVDIGGTFTDLFAWDDRGTGRDQVRTSKVPSTPHDFSVGVIDALRAADIPPGDVSVLLHGTTIATNALIEGKYPEPVLVTTKGFRDVLEIGRQRRERLYDPYQTKVPPIVQRHRRFTVTERTASDGSTVTPLDLAEADAVANQIAALGATNVAVAFINAYQDGEHERQMRDRILAKNPSAYVALSSETRPKVRELGRFVTTAVRAALLPVVSEYVTWLEKRLTEAGSAAALFMVKCNGGMMNAAAAKERPEELIASGPAGGVAAGSYQSAVLDIPNLIVTDVGGTSFEASLLEDGRGLVTDEYEIAWERPLIVPMLDIRSIGAGGGSIAWVDDGGSLRVGPQSAGASPGPACYGWGGTQATVTDANLLLGRISPDLSGKFALDREAAERAVADVAARLGLSTLECAESIVRIVGENMASAIRMVSTDRGRDPRDHAMFAFGGAGGLHAYEIACAAGIQRVVVPPFAGVASAFGATTMDVRHDLESTYYVPLADADPAQLEQSFTELEQRATELLREDGVAANQMVLDRFVAARYVGQSYEVWTPAPAKFTDDAGLDAIHQGFNREHEREYGVYSADLPVSVVNIRVTAVGIAEKPSGGELATAIGPPADQSPARPQSRAVYFAGVEHAAGIYAATELAVDQEITGPAIIEQPDGAVVVPPGAVAHTDVYGNVHLRTLESI